jgi:hypothetical protein
MTGASAARPGFALGRVFHPAANWRSIDLLARSAIVSTTG